MKKIMIIVVVIFIGVFFNSCSKESDTNFPPVIEKFDVLLTVNRNEAFVDVVYRVSDMEGDNLSIRFENSIIGIVISGKELYSNSGVFRINVQKNAPNDFILTVTDGNSEPVSEKINIFVPF